MKPKPKCLFLFDCGQIAVTDEAGQQIPELQGSALSSWATLAESLGYDVDGLEVETQFHTLRLRKTQSGWNIEGMQEKL